MRVQVAPDASTNSQQHQQSAQQAPQDVQQEMIGALRQRSFSPAIVGYETQWLAAAVGALARLEDELRLSDIQQHYNKQCAADRESTVVHERVAAQVYWHTCTSQAEAEEDQVRRKKSEDAYLVEYEFGLQDIHINIKT